MHPAWQIDDIRCLILDHLEPRDSSRLAQTCHSLFGDSTDRLWKNLNSILPFLTCLRPDYRQHPLRAADIHRLDFYSSKVRYLSLEGRNNKEVRRLPRRFKSKFRPNARPAESWEGLWEDIASLRPTTAFLPNIKRIRVDDASEAYILPLIGISGTNLTHIHIKCFHDRLREPTVPRLLDQFQDTPQLEYLFVRDGQDIIPPKLIANSPLKHLRLDPRVRIEHIHGHVDCKVLPLRLDILEKDSLEHLTVGLTREWYTPALNLSKRYLPNLKTLWLNLAPFEHWTPGEVHSPASFFRALDTPNLDLLNIKFPASATDAMFLEVAFAMQSGCNLRQLTKLELTGHEYVFTCEDCINFDVFDFTPQVQPEHLRQAMGMLLPLPMLKSLRLSVAPNFLDVLDLDMYRSIAAGMPALEVLQLGHHSFRPRFGRPLYLENTPLDHFAAFCSLLPNVTEVTVGAANGLAYEWTPREEWASLGVEKLEVGHWLGPSNESDDARAKLCLRLRTYFPNSDVAGSMDRIHSCMVLRGEI